MLAQDETREPMRRAVWRKVDELFPPAWRSAPPVAGVGLLAMGAFCVLCAIAAGA